MSTKDKAISLVKYILKESSWTSSFVVLIILFLLYYFKFDCIRILQLIILFLLYCAIEYFLIVPLHMGLVYFILNLGQLALGWFTIEIWSIIYDEWKEKYADCKD